MDMLHRSFRLRADFEFAPILYRLIFQNWRFVNVTLTIPFLESPVFQTGATTSLLNEPNGARCRYRACLSLRMKEVPQLLG